MKSSGLKGSTIDRYFKIVALIDARKSVEKKVGIMLQKYQTIKQVNLLQVLSNCMKGINNYFLADQDKLIQISPDVICLDNHANNVFLDLPSNPNLSSYNTLINRSIGKSGYIAASAYKTMRSVDNISPDRFTFAFLLKSFASFDQLESGKTAHGQVIKLGFVSDTFVMNSLLHFYFRFVQGHDGLGVARKVFEEMPQRDIVSWNTMISGLVYKTLHYEALLAFDDMLLSADPQCKPDETTLINMVVACTWRKWFEQGKWLDAYIKENKFVLSVPLGNALLAMFVNFKDLGNAKTVFKSMSKRCTLTWKIMISGLVCNGYCQEALLLFDNMCCCCCSEVEEEGGLKPNDDIFRSVLVAFSWDERLVGDGERLFRVINQIVHGFGIKPNRTHYERMIEIFSRAGWVEAAMMLTESLPGEPHTGDWANVLYACQVHGNNLLLDSWIRKISDINSKQGHSPRSMMSTLISWIRNIPDKQGHSLSFMEWTIKSYIGVVFGRKLNNNVSCAKLMVESLIRKLPHRKYVGVLKKNLRFKVRMNSQPDEGLDNFSSVHARETLPPHEHDVYKAVESLDRQLLDLHDQIINVNDDPCQLDM